MPKKSASSREVFASSVRDLNRQVESLGVLACECSVSLQRQRIQAGISEEGSEPACSATLSVSELWVVWIHVGRLFPLGASGPAMSRRNRTKSHIGRASSRTMSSS